MDRAIAERAVQALAALNRRRRSDPQPQPVPDTGPKSSPCTSGPLGDNWPPESLDYERRFGQPHARLFPFLGRKVRTPSGPGILLQVFAERVTVVLDSELSRCSFFAPGQIEPVNWEISE